MSYERIVKDESSVGGLMVVIAALVFVWIFYLLTRSLNRQEYYKRSLENAIQTIPSNEKWAPVGTYKDSILYEQTYPSGKKAWRYMDEAGYKHYPRRREIFTQE